MTWFTDSPFEQMMVQRPKTRKQEQDVSTVLLTEQDHAKGRKQKIEKEDETCSSSSQKNQA